MPRVQVTQTFKIQNPSKCNANNRIVDLTGIIPKRVYVVGRFITLPPGLIRKIISTRMITHASGGGS